MAGGIDNNMRNFNANTMNFAQRVQALGALAYGHGFKEADKGGTGNMGIVGGKAIKFNTKWYERTKTDKLDANDIKYKDMKESCDNLRQQLRKMAFEVRLDMSEEEFKAILEDLGFDKDDMSPEGENGVIRQDAGLFKRTTAASVLKKLASAYDREKKATESLVQTLWGNHTPSYGNSVKVFHEQVVAHEAEVLQSLPQIFDEISDDVPSTNPSDLCFGIAKNFSKISKPIKRWLGKSCDFLLGLVPTNSKNKQPLADIKNAIENGKKDINAILDEIESATALNQANTTKYNKLRHERYERQHVYDVAREKEERQIRGFLENLETKVLEQKESIENGDLASVIKFVEDSDLESDIKDGLKGWLEDNLELTFKASYRGEKNSFSKSYFSSLFANGGSEKIGGKSKQIVGYDGYTVGNSTYYGPWGLTFKKRHDQKIENDTKLKALEDEIQKIETQKGRLQDGYKPKFDPTKTITDAQALIEEGIKAVQRRFGAILKNLNSVTFADGKNYPNLISGDGTDLQLAKNDVTGSFKDIYSDLKTVVNTFENFTDALGVSLESRLKPSVRRSVWKKKITRHTDTYDAICGKTKDKEKRIKYLQDLAAQAGEGKNVEKLKELAKALVSMMGATYFTLDGTQDDDFIIDSNQELGDDNRQFSITGFSVARNAPLLKDFGVSNEGGLYHEANNIKSIKDFKNLVDTLCRRRDKRFGYKGNTGSSIFDSKNCISNNLPAEFPIGFIAENESAEKIAKKYNELGNLGYYGNQAKSIRVSMESFTRLHEVAAAFDVIDKGTGALVWE